MGAQHHGRRARKAPRPRWRPRRRYSGTQGTFTKLVETLNGALAIQDSGPVTVNDQRVEEFDAKLRPHAVARAAQAQAAVRTSTWLARKRLPRAVQKTPAKPSPPPTLELEVFIAPNGLPVRIAGHVRRGRDANHPAARHACGQHPSEHRAAAAASDDRRSAAEGDRTPSRRARTRSAPTRVSSPAWKVGGSVQDARAQAGCGPELGTFIAESKQ